MRVTLKAFAKGFAKGFATGILVIVVGTATNIFLAKRQAK